MQLSEVKELVQVSGAVSANAKIQEGWTLLGFVPGSQQGLSSSGVIYVLGKKEPTTDPLKDFSLGAHATQP